MSDLVFLAIVLAGFGLLIFAVLSESKAKGGY